MNRLDEDCYWTAGNTESRRELLLDACIFLPGKRVTTLKIVKVLNNNVVLSQNEKKEDIIIMGSGIAFQKKRGDVIEEAKIERIFSQQVSDLATKFQSMLNEIPEEYLEITEKIIQRAQERLEYELNDNLYIALMDHIHFSVQRYCQGMMIRNELLTETRMMYRKEYEAAQESLDLINRTFGVELPEDEVGFIAFHFVNAGGAGNMEDTVQRTKIVQDALTIIRNYFKLEFQEDSLDYYRLVTHLKFFVQRLTERKPLSSAEGDEQLLELVENSYRESYECVKRIAKYIHLEFGYEVSRQEKLYLTIHIERVRKLND